MLLNATGTGSGGARPQATSEVVSASGGEDGDAEDGDLEDGGDTGEMACITTPDVAWVRPYDGQAARTVGRALVRGPDGTLYMGGSSADEASMFIWIAATDELGEIQWEYQDLPRLGQNLVGSPPGIAGLSLLGDSLLYVGRTMEPETAGLFGRLDLATVSVERVTLTPEALWNTVVGDEAQGVFVGGRAGTDTWGARIDRLGGRDPGWSISTQESDSFDDNAAEIVVAGDSLYVAGRRQEFPLVERYDAETGAVLWSDIIVSGAVFEADLGEFSGLTVSPLGIVGAGDIRHQKPDPRDGVGSFTFNEPYIASWSPDGQFQWSWQRGPTSIRPGAFDAVTTGPDGTIFAVGQEAHFDDDDSLLVAAFSPQGDLLWTIDDQTSDVDLVGHRGVAVAAGDEGQLYVLSYSRILSDETTALIEICY